MMTNAELKRLEQVRDKLIFALIFAKVEHPEDVPEAQQLLDDAVQNLKRAEEEFRESTREKK